MGSKILEIGKDAGYKRVPAPPANIMLQAFFYFSMVSRGVLVTLLN